MNPVHWGSYSVTLLIGSLQGFVLAALLLRTRANLLANRALALLIVAVVLRLTPYTLGFAGYYDYWRWLNFFPFYWDLAFGPLAWLYVRQLGWKQLPRQWAWHFLPVVFQAGYYVAVCAFVPVAERDSYNDHVHFRYVLPLFVAARLVSYLCYAVATARSFNRYQRWLERHGGLRHGVRLDWLRRLLLAVAAILFADAGLSCVGVGHGHLSYHAEFPLYVVLAILIWVLGLEGWRNAALPYPRQDESGATASGGRDRAPPDWVGLGQSWLAQIDAQEWWREPDISLPVVARRLGTNTAYLSRALNVGTGQSFNHAISTLRVAAATRRLRGTGPILEVAAEVGFSSKATFNRVFKEHTGLTPSAYREQAASPGLSPEKPAHDLEIGTTTSF